MDRHVRRVGDQIAFRVEDGAGEVQPLLDVHRIGRVLQGRAHLLCDGHEEVVEDLQHHRVDLRADRRRALQRHHPLQFQMVAHRQAGLPAGIDDRRGRRLDDDRRPVQNIAGHQIFPQIDRRVVPVIRRIHAYAVACLQRHIARRLPLLRVFDVLAAAHGFDRNGLHDEALFRHDKAVALLVRRVEAGGHLGLATMFHHDGGIGALIAQMSLRQAAHGGGGNALGHNLLRGVLAKLFQQAVQLRHGRRFENRLYGLFAQGPQVRQAHAIGRQHAGQGVQEYPRHAEGVGDVAGMLAAGPAEAVQRVFRHVIAALGRDFLDGICHVFDGDAAKTCRGFFRPPRIAGGLPDFLGQRLELLHDDLAVQGLVCRRAEDLRKKVRHDAAHHDIAVGHGERPAAAVAGRSRIGPGAVRSDPVARAVEVQDRAAARRHGMDLHHGRAHAHAGHLGFEGPLVLAVVVRHIRGRAAHIEGDDLVHAAHSRRADRTDDAARRTRKDGVLALKELWHP